MKNEIVDEKYADVDFDSVFGAFHSKSIEQSNEPVSKIEIIGEDYAQPCRCCGSQPEVHTMNFKDKEKYPLNFYICCSHCSSCDGKWYPDRKTAIMEWNNMNMGSRPKGKYEKDLNDTIDEVMGDFRIKD